MFDKEAMVRYYEDLLALHGKHYRSLDWKSDRSQEIRFRAFQLLFTLGKKKDHFSVLDLGCGFGDFYGFLKKEGLIERLKISYTGYDIAPRILEVARGRYPEAAAGFEVKDILEEEKVRRFDYVFASGVFNIRLVEEAAHLAFVEEMLHRLYDLSTQGAAINFLSVLGLPLVAAEEKEEKQYYYFKPEWAAALAQKLASRFMLRHDYHPADLTLYLLKEW